MYQRRLLLAGVLVIIVSGPATTSNAEPPWMKLVPFKRVEPRAPVQLELTEEQGPWMILATSFAGPGAENQARELAAELRQRFKMDAFIHRRTFDYTKPVTGLGLNPDGTPKTMKHRKSNRFDEIAVLVGNYVSVDDARVTKDLEKIKRARPKALEIDGKDGSQSTQRFVGLRELQRRLNPTNSVKGPMRKAFVARNPLLPKEYYSANGVDTFVLKMNKRVKYSLLDNPAKFTVRVASFTGETFFQGEELEEKKSRFPLPGRGEPSKLELAADRAHRLTVALRERGVEAYEFHDVHESLVTVGSFDSIGHPRPDKRIELRPEVVKIMETYGAAKKQLPGAPVVGLQPRTLNGIKFDVQPMPVEVPRSSIGSTYARR